MKVYKEMVFAEKKEISDLIKSKKISGPLEVRTTQERDGLLIKGNTRCLNKAIKYAKKNQYNVASINSVSRLPYDKTTMIIFEFYKLNKKDHTNMINYLRTI